MLYEVITGEDYPPYKNGMPQYVQLKSSPVARRLDKDFEVK